MSINNIEREELQTSLVHLERAVHNHIQWYNALIRTLCCRLQSDRHDISPQAHHECLFGQWYYDQAPLKIQKHPGFTAIGEAHERMHHLAANLLQISNAGFQINMNDYDHFANAVERLQLEINSLKRELEIMLYTHDPLTGAINRIDMMPMLREWHDMIKRTSMICTVVMIDLDEFKTINDRYGHSAGDKVLVATSRYLLDNLRPYDKMFRFGGEEFLLCMQQTELHTAFNRCEMLRKGIAEMNIDIEDRDPIHITASFGITILDPNSPLETCIERSDKAMYAAKSAGRNCTKIWESN